MTEHPGAWLLAIGGGGAVAAAYFASLWWIVRRVPRSRHPAWLVAGSGLLRVPLAALALFAAAGGDLLALPSLGDGGTLQSLDGGGRLLAALAGFLAVREIAIRAVRGGAFPVPAGAHPAKR